MTPPKPTDTETVVYVAVSRDLLPQLHAWSDPIRLRVAEEQDGILVLELKRGE